MPGGVLLLPVLLLMAGMLLEGEPTHMPCACVEVDPRLQYSDTRKARIPRLKALHEKEPRGRMVLGRVDKGRRLKP